MRHFTVEYNSDGNGFFGSRVVSAITLAEAQTMFLEWLMRQPNFSHLWKLSFEFEEHQTLDTEV